MNERKGSYLGVILILAVAIGGALATILPAVLK